MAGLRPAPALSIGARATAELLERYGLRPDKRLGQHFLIDPNQVDRIVRLAGVEAGDHVVEVGPGLGALTAGLVDAGATVVAVEIDEGLVRVIEGEFDIPQVSVVHADALEVDWSTAAPPEHSWAMVANLPYNVATPLVLDVLDDVPQVTSMLVMVQREVAERLVAMPGSSSYGVPSVKVAYWATGELVAKIPPSVFLPPPRVESALVKLDRHATRRFDEPVDQVFTLVRAAFNQRRKMLRKSLGALVSAEVFEAAGVDPQTRPEQVGVEAWVALARARRIAAS